MKVLVVVISLLSVSALAGCHHGGSSLRQKEEAVRQYPYLAEPYGEYRDRNARRDAEDDFVRGHPRILVYGMPVPWIREYGEVLRRDYGVTVETVAGCVVTSSLVEYAATYNQAIRSHLTSVHGPGVFEKADTAAQALYAERHQP